MQEENGNVEEGGPNSKGEAEGEDAPDGKEVCACACVCICVCSKISNVIVSVSCLFQQNGSLGVEHHKAVH